MTIWLIALVLTAIACAALYFAGARRTVNAGPSVADATAEHLRAQLGAIEADLATGRLGPAEATAARGEIAREALRLKGEGRGAAETGLPLWLPVLAVAILSVGTYAMIGRPDLPAAPLAARADVNLDLGAAIASIEARLAEAPDDLRGWQVIAPAYMQMGRYEDAERALRQINALSPPSADSLTDLAEVLMMRQGGAMEGEALDLLRAAQQLDPRHVRSLYYIANEETRQADYEAAIRDWNALLALAEGDEPWVVTARDGLAFAQAALDPASAPPAPDQAQIDAMVDGLAERLQGTGGTLEEWTRLVQSRIVQGRLEEAQAAYDAARAAYPDAAERNVLDSFALGNGLVAQ